jgi:hypothetical protein
MSPASIFLTLLGLATAMLGFLKRPRTAGELVYPRFFVPLFMWLMGMFPASYYYLMQPPRQKYESLRYGFQEQALLYVLLCTACFWVGYRIHIRIRPLHRMTENISIRFNHARLQQVGIATASVVGAFLIALQGSNLWNGHDTMQMSGVAGYILRYLIPPLSALAAIAYGFGWPEKGEPRRVLSWVGAIYILSICSLPLIATFSRGSGLYVLLMVLGYIGRFRRIPWLTATGAFILLIYAAHVGLAGRGVYGHTAGAERYLSYFFSGADFSFVAATERIMAGEALTPLSVVFAAGANHADLRPLSVLQWWYFQLPIPHMFGIGGEYTLDATLFLGGTGSWGYTVSFFGDTFAHMSWWGCLAFIYMGMLYRILEGLVEGSHGSDREAIAFLALPVAYLALMFGMFNTFRAWNSAFTFGIGILIVALWVYSNLRKSSGEDIGLAEPEFAPSVVTPTSGT